MVAHDLGEMNSICPSCKALHFSSERVKGSSLAAPRFQTCCKEGQVVLDPIPEPPEVLRRLWTSEEAHCKRFRKSIRKYNNAFAFTSFNFTPDRRLEEQGVRGGIRSFAVHGEIYHQIGTVPTDGTAPRYAQLYYLDPDEANNERVRQGGLERWIVGELSSVIAENNPFHQFYHTALESLRASNTEQEGETANLERRAILDADFRLVIREGADRRRENLPTVSEFAIIMPDTTDKDAREIILFERRGDGSLSTRLQYIHRGHPAYLPLHYVLFYPFGNPGYRWKMPLTTRSRRVLGNDDEEELDDTPKGCISARQFYRYV